LARQAGAARWRFQLELPTLPKIINLSAVPINVQFRLKAVRRVSEVPMNMRTSVRQLGSVTVVDMKGRIVLGEESASVRDLTRDLLSKGHKKILFNLGDVDYIDSSGLGSLVSAFTSVKKAGGELKLLNLTDKVESVLQITKLYTVFEILDDETVAVKSFENSQAATV
jgi:anti-sigma B factor antagonist